MLTSIFDTVATEYFFSEHHFQTLASTVDYRQNPSTAMIFWLGGALRRKRGKKSHPLLLADAMYFVDISLKLK
jgi:hypothetical protein